MSYSRSGEGRPLEDANLVEQAKDGDVEAYGCLVERYQQVAFRTAYLVTADAAEAEDATQEAFVKAYRALGRFRSGEPFRPWILQIVANEARNRRRAAGRRAALAWRTEPKGGADRRSGDAAPSLELAIAADPSPEAAAIAGEERATLLAALSQLREDDRLVLAYRYFLDLGEAEMAAALDCARGTVKSRLSRALGRLRVVFGAQPAEERGVLG